MFRGLFAESTYNNNSSKYGKQKSCPEDAFSETKQKLYDDVLCKLNETNSENYEPDWKTLRIQMATTFMANMINSDLLYKEIAAFSVKCADALIEELQKEC